MTPFDRLGRFVLRRARIVIVAWAVLIAIALSLAPLDPDALRAAGSAAMTSNPPEPRPSSSTHATFPCPHWSSRTTATP